VCVCVCRYERVWWGRRRIQHPPPYDDDDDDNTTEEGMGRAHTHISYTTHTTSCQLMWCDASVLRVKSDGREGSDPSERFQVQRHAFPTLSLSHTHTPTLQKWFPTYSSGSLYACSLHSPKSRAPTDGCSLSSLMINDRKPPCRAYCSVAGETCRS
jgi:hypothetical protein